MRKFMSKFPIFLLIICFFASFGGCAPQTEGETFNAFINRLNESNETYNIAPEGFIFQPEEKNLYKFFKLNEEKTLLLSLKINEDKFLTELHLTTENNFTEDDFNYEFICNCIYAFCNEEDNCNDLLNKIDLKTVLKKQSYFTTTAETDSIEIKIDTTELGVVISVYKDI